MTDERLRSKGFSLIELMTVVLIMGILAAVAIPSYMKYIRKSRLSEALTNLASIDTYEESYFSENDQYLCLVANPATVPTGGNKVAFTGGLPDWSALGSVVASGTPVYFQYQAWAGKFAAAPPALVTGIAGLGCLAATAATVAHPGSIGACNLDVAAAGTTGIVLGIPQVANSNFFFITAVGDQKQTAPTNKCSLHVKIIDRPDLYKQDEID